MAPLLMCVAEVGIVIRALCTLRDPPPDVVRRETRVKPEKRHHAVGRFLTGFSTSLVSGQAISFVQLDLHRVRYFIVVKYLDNHLN